MLSARRGENALGTHLLFLRKKNGAQGRNRTTDTRIFSPLLYQLSYLGTSRSTGLEPAISHPADDPAG